MSINSNLLKTPTWSATPEKGNQLNSVAISDDGSFCITGTSQEYGSGNFSTYCYDSSGNQQWSTPIGKNVKDGVFWVCMSSNGQYAASGGEDFIAAFDVASGSNIMDSSSEIDGRINEVEITSDGSYITAVVGSELLLFQLQDNSGSEQYVQSDWWSRTSDYPNLYLRSVGISQDGRYIIAGGQYGDNVTTGIALLFYNDNGALDLLKQWEYEGEEVLRVVISNDGEYSASSTNQGKVRLNHNETNLWTYQPETEVDLTYPLAISGSDGTVYVAAGANLQHKMPQGKGLVYVVKDEVENDEHKPVQLWQQVIQYDPNPGMYMDEETALLTAVDGEPIHDQLETPGNFYLFNAMTGEQVGRHPTKLMNWGMDIAADGSTVVGGSDDGTCYFWKLGTQ